MHFFFNKQRLTLLGNKCLYNASLICIIICHEAYFTLQCIVYHMDAMRHAVRWSKQSSMVPYNV